MVDAIFADRRLAAIYDWLEGERDDLDAYLAIVDEFEARAVVDVGCGTGTLACLLAERGLDVVGVDPAAASLEVARGKPAADSVRWILGDATTLPPLQMDLATMTGNVAQVFLTDDDWRATLRGIRAALRPGGRFVFETRDPARRAWLEWNRDRTYEECDVPGVGTVSVVARPAGRRRAAGHVPLVGRVRRRRCDAHVGLDAALPRPRRGRTLTRRGRIRASRTCGMRPIARAVSSCSSP